MKTSGIHRSIFHLAIAAGLVLGGGGLALAEEPATKWLSGDFHQHTYYTDGSDTFDFVMEQNVRFGLDWWANSEHGGERNRDGNGMKWDDPSVYPEKPILGWYEESGGHQEMWRWQSLRDFVYPDVLRWRAEYPEKRIFSGLEWNVPGHEHCSVGVVADGPEAISAFEYMFDASDEDFSREGEVTPFGTLTKQNGYFGFEQRETSVKSYAKTKVEQHEDAVAACAWMQAQYDAGLIDNAWIIFAHIERRGPWNPIDGRGYNVENFRDFYNAGPDVCFGFEGSPGHQTSGFRGFGNLLFGGSRGGTGFYTSEIGGLWDAMLGEGRPWFNFASSDYHRYYTEGGSDFYPGEYQKTWVEATDEDNDGDYSLNEIANALRAGKSWFVMGDLIDYLEFTLEAKGQKVGMGGTLTVSEGDAIYMTIKARSPETNFNGDSPLLDHIDLIGGAVTGFISPEDPRYTDATNPTTELLWQFHRNQMQILPDGTMVLRYAVKVPKGLNGYYVRLRGTNMPNCTPYETDCQGNPLPDYLVTENLGFDREVEAWRDLWFYSNPIFIEVE